MRLVRTVGRDPGRRFDMRKITWNDLLKQAERGGANLAEMALMRMMDEIGEDTGVWPDWDDEAPKWVVESVM